MTRKGLKKYISLILVLAMVITGIIQTPIEVKAATTISMREASVTYGSYSVAYDGLYHYPSISYVGDLTGINVSVLYDDENSDETPSITGWPTEWPKFKEVGTHRVQVTMQDSADSSDEQIFDVYVRITGDGGLAGDEDDYDDFEDDGDGSDESDGGESGEETPGGETPGETPGGSGMQTGDPVRYFKTEYAKAVTNVNSNGSDYTIVFSDDRNYDYELYTGTEAYAEARNYFRNDAYCDNESRGTINFRNPFRYYINNISYTVNESGRVLEIKVKYVIDDDIELNDSVISSNLSQMRDTEADILSQVSAEMSLTEKILAIHDGMIRELDLDYSRTAESKLNSNWYLLSKRKGTDKAFASLFYYYMTKIGTECRVLRNADNHYWNLVKIGSQWYHVDLAMDSLVLDSAGYVSAYGNKSSNTMYGDTDHDEYDIGYVGHKYFMKTDAQMRAYGYGRWDDYFERTDSINENPAQTSTAAIASGIYVDREGAIPYLAGNWYYANPDGETNSFTKTSFGEASTFEIATEFPVRYLCTDGLYLYYTDGDCIYRTNSYGNVTYYSDVTRIGQAVSEFTVKDGLLTYIMLDRGEDILCKRAPASMDWILMDDPEEENPETPTDPSTPGDPGTPGDPDTPGDPGTPTDPPVDSGSCDHSFAGGSINIPPTCSHRGKNVNVCVLCGYERINYEYGDQDHSNHEGAEQLEDFVAATCTEYGFSGNWVWSCCGDAIPAGTVIGDVIVTDGTPTPTIPHDYDEATCNHKSTCTRCGAETGEVDPDNHVGRHGVWMTGGEPVVTTTAQPYLEETCTEAGYTGDDYCFDCGAVLTVGRPKEALGHTGGQANCSYKAVCTRCNQEYGELDDTNHNYHSTVTPPTCEDQGYTTYQCSYCGDAYNDNYVGVLGHNYAPATCHTEATCIRCQATDGNGFAPDNHSGGNEIRGAVEANCTEAGYSGDLYCRGCDALIQTGITIGAVGHSGGQATCSNRAVCSRCGEYYGDYDATNHAGPEELRDYIAASCVQTGYSGDMYCLACGVMTSQGIVTPYAPHRYVDTVIQPTCTQRGYTHHECRVCGDAYDAEYVDAWGHDYEVIRVEADSTTHTNGYILVKCRVCGDVQSNTPIAYAQTATLSCTSYTYNGSRKKPTVTVIDSNGDEISKDNYTVAYTNNLKVGKATVKVTLTGDYSGTFTKNFTIKPAGTSFTKVAGITKGIRVYWKKQPTQTTGYQIQYSTSSNFPSGSTATVSTTKGFTSKQISRLVANKKYYVRIRTYTKVTIDGASTNIYSSWSSTKTVKSK